MPHDDRLRLAVFIDFDNIEIGVKNSLGMSFDAGLVLEALKERGEVVSKTAYSDWQRAGGYSRALTQHAIKMVQRNLTPGGDKNGADINLALDALEMAFTHPHINAFVIVGGDSDFISLLEKLKQYDKKVFVVGGRQFTSGIMQRNCHEFIAYEHLVGAGTGAPQAAGGARRGRQAGTRDGREDRTPIEQAIPLVTRALTVLSEREVSPQLGLLKTTLLQLDSTFSERTYGAGSFRDFAEKLERAGVLKVQQTKGGWIVSAADGPGAAPAGDAVDDGGMAVADASAPPDHQGPAMAADASAQRGTTADGVGELARLLTTGSIRRWPMYLRNVKQLLRQSAPPLDERAYGFPNLMDFLRAAQRDGLVRLERDRQGVVRVFQGAALAATSATSHPAEALPMTDEASAEIPDMAPAFPSALETPAEPAAEGEPDDSQIAILGRVERRSGDEPAEVERPAAGARRRRPRGPQPSGRLPSGRSRRSPSNSRSK